MDAATGSGKLTVRQAVYSLLDALREPTAVLSDTKPAPDEMLDGDAGLLYSARRTLASLMLDNARLREELHRAKGTST